MARRRRRVVRYSTPTRRTAGRRVDVSKRIRTAQHRTLVAAGLAAAGLGWAERRGVDVPAIPALGVPGTYGLLGYVAGVYLKNDTLLRVSTGLVAIAAYDLAKTGTTVQGGAIYEGSM